MNTKIIKLDINRRLYDKIVAKQDDTGSRFLLFQLLDGAVPFNLTDRSVRVYGVKPDGAVIFNDLTVTHSATGFCLLELTNQMLAIAGTVKLELMITEGDKKLTSIPFEMEVIKKINSNDAVESSNEFRALLNALKEIDDWNKEFADKSGKLEELYTPRLNELGSQLENIVNYTIKDNETLNMSDIVNNSYIKILSGEYTSNKEDYALKIENKKNIIIEGWGKIKCPKNGILIKNCENIFIRETAFERILQSKFGEDFNGILIDNSINVFIEKNSCYKFTDGIKVINGSTDVFVLKNIAKYCSEEGIVFTEDCNGVVEDNRISKHLGDGILIKSVNGVKVKNNRIKDPIGENLTPDQYAEMISELNPEIPRPILGGGITTNVEHSIKQAKNVEIEKNYISDTAYGVGIIGGENVDILYNTISNVLESSILISNDITYNQNKLNSENINIIGNKLLGLTTKNKTNLINIIKSSDMNIYNVKVDGNIINCKNDTVAHTGIYSNVNAKIINNIIDNYNFGIYSIGDNADIRGNTLIGLSQYSEGKVGIYAKGGKVEGNTLNCNDNIAKAQIILETAIGAVCCDNKIKYNGSESAIQLLNNSKWCILDNNSFEITSDGLSYGGGSLYNGTNKIDGYYRSNTIPSEQGFMKDDIVIKANGDIGDVVGWINQGSKTASNFKEYGQRGFKSVDGQPSYAPRFIGEEAYDWRNKVFYKGVGTTISDWKVMC